MANHTKRLAELASQGKSAAQIAALLKAEGAKTSRSSIGRELRKLRGAQRVGRRSAVPLTPTSSPPAGDDSEPVNVDAVDPKTFDDLLEMAGRALNVAEKKGDLAALARFGNLATSILEAKRKAAPPSSMPDGTFVTGDAMRELAAEGEERFLRLIQGTFKEVNNWPKCRACGQPVEPKT